MSVRTATILVVLFVAACGGGGGGSEGDPSSGGQAGFGTPPTTADISLLFMGNSHTLTHNIPGMVVAMVQAGKPDKTVGAAVAPGSMFLEERFRDQATLDLLRSQNWSFVILQAQKYSSSGQFSYSTAEAEELIRLSRQANAVPIMFPEWPRAGIPETQRIYDLHVSIAQRQTACVAPIGQAWDLALATNSSVTLHDQDGNHSSAAGAFLAALVLYATITGLSPLDLPTFTQVRVDAATQSFLRDIADQTVRMLPPRLWCPTDPFP